MKNRFLVLLCFFTLIYSCNKKTHTVDSPQQGNITIATDESFKSLAEALTDRYMALYPETKINLKIEKEDLGLLDLLDNKVKVIVMSRDLSEQEKKAYKDKVDLDLIISNFAADAVLFVVPKNSPKESITIEELKEELKSDKKNIIFDGNNSSNLNFVAQKLNTVPNNLKFSIISGNKNLISQLDNFPGKIGVVSLNTFSRPYDPESENLRNAVKVLKVVDGEKSFEPTLQNLARGTYPFTRILYFISNEKYFGLGSGFIRFSCTQLGQIVVAKEGLQPYHIFKREVQIR
ncbi:phosphate ABC transporter substrate-binding protein [Chryseobacterium sp. SNU WT5]|uniref:PstS family phosphate ABC transporter substrate-binding protein n=1 Tax=Chryseobacterium sp. SNU WT5 TaxID=2594269 RepID=UPI00117C0CDF|nr:substrate-binding domain-containing protein [Chryseobacterium sp. SNU WT5]QDP85640.1 phosphate ABC transporter substrate-binding protein [Chryseobacterium sp. SNU WT5]